MSKNLCRLSPFTKIKHDTNTQMPQIPYLQYHSLKTHHTKHKRISPHNNHTHNAQQPPLKKSQKPSTKNAFILLDFVLAIGILSLIVIVLSQATLYFQRHSLSKSTKQLKDLEANNAIDIVRNLVELESNIDFSHNTLRLPNHIIRLDSNNLLFDDSPILRGVSSFFITTTNNESFSILLCFFENPTKQSCITRAGFLSTNTTSSNTNHANHIDKNQTSNNMSNPANITQNLAN